MLVRELYELDVNREGSLRGILSRGGRANGWRVDVCVGVCAVVCVGVCVGVCVCVCVSVSVCVGVCAVACVGVCADDDDGLDVAADWLLCVGIAAALAALMRGGVRRMSAPAYVPSMCGGRWCDDQLITNMSHASSIGHIIEVHIQIRHSGWQRKKPARTRGMTRASSLMTESNYGANISAKMASSNTAANGY